jgi:hypothetical protein
LDSDIEAHIPTLVFDAAFPTNNITRAVRLKYLKQLTMNLEATIRNDSQYIYLGSYSNHPKSKSKYGRLKREAERIVLQKGGNILRLGLVVDPSNPMGRYSQFLQVAKYLPVTPVLPENWCPIFITTLSEFNLGIEDCILTRNVHSIKTLGTRMSVNEFLSSTNTFRRKVKIPQFLMVPSALITMILPLGNLDFLKSILYKDESK